MHNGDFWSLLKTNGYKLGPGTLPEGREPIESKIALTQGTTIFGLKYKEGVLVAGDRRATGRSGRGGANGAGAMVAAGASAFNQIYERDTDGLMARTKNRPLVVPHFVPLVRIAGVVQRLAIECAGPLKVARPLGEPWQSADDSLNCYLYDNTPRTFDDARAFCDEALDAGQLRRELGDSFIAVEIDSSPGNPHGIPRMAHSVVTEHLVDEPGHPTRAALDQVLDFFETRLRA